MSNLNQFMGSPAVTSIVNKNSSGGNHVIFGSIVLATLSNMISGKAVYSGALTAATLSPVLSITGESGYLDVCVAHGANATSRTHTLKITLDGVVVFNATTDACTANSNAIVAVGSTGNASTGSAVFGNGGVKFNTSCLIEYASSLTETDLSLIYYGYRLTA